MLRALMAGAPTPAIDKCISCSKPLLTENKKARVQCVDCFHTEHAGLPVTAASHYYLPLRLAAQPLTGDALLTGTAVSERHD